MLAGRVGYELSSGLGFEIDFGQIGGLEMTNRRKTTLLGEQQTPVAVDIKDQVTVGGLFFGVGASYTFLRKPVIAAFAVGVSQWYAKIEVTREGTAVTDEAPSPRTMTSTSNQDTATFTVFSPELRFGYPVHEHLEIGIGLGAFIVPGADVRPKVVQTPEATATDTQPESNGKTIGFVPQPNATPESAISSFGLFRGSVYVRAPF
jgi:hypothetical protein